MTNKKINKLYNNIELILIDSSSNWVKLTKTAAQSRIQNEAEQFD
jgi:hypothetical protein